MSVEEDEERKDRDGSDEIAKDLVDGLCGSDGDAGGAGRNGESDQAVFTAEASVDGRTVAGDAPCWVVAEVEDEDLGGCGVKGEVHGSLAGGS